MEDRIKWSFNTNFFCPRKECVRDNLILDVFLLVIVHVTKSEFSKFNHLRPFPTEGFVLNEIESRHAR